MYWQRLSTLLTRLCTPIVRADILFLRMKNVSVITNQMIFLLLADCILLSEPKMTSIYTLMFYNIVTYCISYIKELIEKENRSPYVTLTETSNVKHLAMSATKIWMKAIAFVATLTFLLMVLGLEQGLKHYRPTTIYTIVTWIYYSSTEKVLVEMFPSVWKLMNLEILEKLEELYAPVILKSFTIGISALSIAVLVPVVSWKFSLVATYFNVYLGFKDLLLVHGPALKLESEILNRYRRATPREIERFDDVCAVCLCGMVKARVTPCNHLFHADCLRQCLKTSDTCPVCKRELTFPTVPT